MAASHNTLEPTRWIWLTDDVNMNDIDFYGQNLEDETQLRKPLGFIKNFTDDKDCISYIKSIQGDYIILTISGRFARHIIPDIHVLPQLSAVYILCKPENKQRNIEWSKDYLKVKAVVSHGEEYFTAIYQNHIKSSISAAISHVRFHDTTPYNIFYSTESTFKALSGENGNFLWMQLLVEVLLNLNPSTSAMNEFIKMCHEFIKRDNSDMKNIFIFASIYDPLNSIKWYTKQSVIYRFINEILRSGDIDKLILLRMVVRDINNQLREEHRKFVEPNITVYRGQAMKLTELKHLQKHIGNFISMNSFLSTSKNCQVALGFANLVDTSDSSLRSVLFKIDCDTCRQDTKPFADVSHLSYYKNEAEVLFMLGSVFRVQNVYESETNGRWIVKMTLCGKNDYDFDNIFQPITNDLATNPSLTSLGLVFQKMGDIKRAEKCFQQHLDLLDGEDYFKRAACYHNLGNTARENGHYDEALDFFQKSMTIRLNSHPIDKSNMGALCNDIGTAYDEKQNHKTAREYYERAHSYTRESVGENHKLSATIYCNSGDNYRLQNEYDLALNSLNKSLEILKSQHLENSPEFATASTNIGLVYQFKHEYMKALKHMKEALDIQIKTLPGNHVKLAISYNNIGLVHAEARKFDLALENLKEAERIFQAVLPIGHPKLRDIAQNIETVEAMKADNSCHDIIVRSH